jgi:transposase
VKEAATNILRMQKALTQMNLQLANVISDLSGRTGQKIMRAIMAGEREPHQLSELLDPRNRASQEEIAKSLVGDWHPELVFMLTQEVDMYDTYQQRIAECDQQLQKQLAAFVDKTNPLKRQGEHYLDTQLVLSRRAFQPQRTRVVELSGECKRIIKPS